LPQLSLTTLARGYTEAYGRLHAAYLEGTRTRARLALARLSEHLRQRGIEPSMVVELLASSVRSQNRSYLKRYAIRPS
jgi:hypothetical protein